MGHGGDDELGVALDSFVVVVNYKFVRRHMCQGVFVTTSQVRPCNCALSVLTGGKFTRARVRGAAGAIAREVKSERESRKLCVCVRVCVCVYVCVRV